ncbi:hypothetical protein ACWKSP_14005 [Micromonosporaceae bacterium Da 78-11]
MSPHHWWSVVGIGHLGKGRVLKKGQTEFSPVDSVLGDVLDQFRRHEQDILGVVRQFPRVQHPVHGYANVGRSGPASKIQTELPHRFVRRLSRVPDVEITRLPIRI